MEEVWAAADTVLGLGERPTIERVRQQLGRGSPNTVGPMLDGWYGSLAKRLQTPADGVEGVQDPDNQLPNSVLKAAKTLWGRALQQAHESATAQFSNTRAELEERAEELRQAEEEFKREQQRLKDRSEAYAVAMGAKDAQIAELSRQAQELQQQLLGCQQQLDSARSEGAQMRQVAEAERRRNDSKDAEHQIERSRIEERAQAQERRLHAEVDRMKSPRKPEPPGSREFPQPESLHEEIQIQ
ncbi:DNA-binding protein [Alicycliphilus denitrificans]